MDLKTDSANQLLSGRSSLAGLNITEHCEVPSSEHVAEIVGRQGCKIKELRNRTYTYIKTPARGDRPVFTITGRQIGVHKAKAEILAAANHFTRIRSAHQRGALTGYFPTWRADVRLAEVTKNAQSSTWGGSGCLTDFICLNYNKENNLCPCSSQPASRKYLKCIEGSTSFAEAHWKSLERRSGACHRESCSRLRITRGSTNPLPNIRRGQLSEIWNSPRYYTPYLCSNRFKCHNTKSNLMDHQEYFSTMQLRVPCGLVGLVIGSKGSTIKRIQTDTQTRIVTPPKNADPVFEISGNRANVVNACRLIGQFVVSKYKGNFYSAKVKCCGQAAYIDSNGTLASTCHNSFRHSLFSTTGRLLSTYQQPGKVRHVTDQAITRASSQRSASVLGYHLTEQSYFDTSATLSEGKNTLSGVTQDFGHVLQHSSSLEREPVHLTESTRLVTSDISSFKSSSESECCTNPAIICGTGRKTTQSFPTWRCLTRDEKAQDWLSHRCGQSRKSSLFIGKSPVPDESCCQYANSLTMPSDCYDTVTRKTVCPIHSYGSSRIRDKVRKRNTRKASDAGSDESAFLSLDEMCLNDCLSTINEAHRKRNMQISSAFTAIQTNDSQRTPSSIANVMDDNWLSNGNQLYQSLLYQSLYQLTWATGNGNAGDGNSLRTMTPIGASYDAVPYSIAKSCGYPDYRYTADTIMKEGSLVTENIPLCNIVFTHYYQIEPVSNLSDLSAGILLDMGDLGRLQSLMENSALEVTFVDKKQGFASHAEIPLWHSPGEDLSADLVQSHPVSFLPPLP